MEIDLVYLWVDGNDPEWKKKKEAFTGIPAKNSEADTDGRYINNDELRYSLRSADKYAPWIRQIFIITDNQIPAWLNVSHPKVKVVDHKDIFPPEILPSFNSSVIEYYLYKIPGLSEHFLFANDDMFFNAAVTPDLFFAPDGYPYIRLKRKILGKAHHMLKARFRKLGQYRQMLVDSMLLVEKKFGVFYSGVPHHNIDAFRKSDYKKAVEEIFHEEAEKSKVNRTRKHGDLHRSAFAYYTLAIGHGHLRYITGNEACRILIYKHDFTKRLNRYRPILFCLNDDQHVTQEDRQKVKPFLEGLFPEKSPYEK
jgi:hypothetical protein